MLDCGALFPVQCEIQEEVLNPLNDRAEKHLKKEAAQNEVLKKNPTFLKRSGSVVVKDPSVTSGVTHELRHKNSHS